MQKLVCIPTACLLLLLFAGLALANSFAQYDSFFGLTGDYCQTRSDPCCLGRKDDCSVPILGTLCYCDHFCNRTDNPDCCPDYARTCLGLRPPEPIIERYCTHNGVQYHVGQKIRMNCNECECKQLSLTHTQFDCSDEACVIRPELIQQINSGDFGWRAQNYSFFYGQRLDDGIVYRLGTFKPERRTVDMNEIFQRSIQLPESFDARQRWPGLIHPVKDQGQCGASWAVSTTAVAEDRLAISTNGRYNMSLSAQELISCQSKRQQDCTGGHVDRAWRYMLKYGVVTEECYPYKSGMTQQPGPCRRKRGAKVIECPTGITGTSFYASPTYRIAPREESIMQEMYTNGPVQATFHVKEDFFMYRSGVYRHSNLSKLLPTKFQKSGWHSVKVIGWGVDSSQGRPVKYWLCANSWGTQWGEDGFFRIAKGEDESQIEMFVIGGWATPRWYYSYRRRNDI